MNSRSENNKYKYFSVSDIQNPSMLSRTTGGIAFVLLSDVKPVMRPLPPP